MQIAESIETCEAPQQANSAEVEELANQIMAELFINRRLLPNEDQQPCDFVAEAEPHIEAIRNRVRNQQPLELILPGFPAKSPNTNKTLGPLPDLAEKNALDILNGLVVRLNDIYEPGAKMIICSDGRVFSDLVKIRDEDVSAYGKYLKQYCEKTYGDTFQFFNLDDVFGAIKSFDTMREELLVRFGESIESLRQRCKTDKTAEAMYKGITRFLLEDYSGLAEFENATRSSIQREAKMMSYRVIQRSNAWTRLLEAHFEDFIRLSIHPQFRVSSKIGIYLGSTEDCWLTPWHSVAVKKNGTVRLMKRFEAEREGMLAYEDGRPSHFEVINASSAAAVN